MKKYRSHKIVHASPMSRGEFVEKMVSKNPDRSNDITHGSPEDEGYHVIYSRNTKDHYESWSPKKVFDEGYTEI